MDYQELLTQIYKMSPDELKRPVLIYDPESDTYRQLSDMNVPEDSAEDSPYLILP